MRSLSVTLDNGLRSQREPGESHFQPFALVVYILVVVLLMSTAIPDGILKDRSEG